MSEKARIGAAPISQSTAHLLLLLLLMLADGKASTGGVGSNLPGVHGDGAQRRGPDPDFEHCALLEPLPLEGRARVASSSCETCRAPFLPRAVAQNDDGRLDAPVLNLVRGYVTHSSSNGERASSFAHGMMKLRLGRFFPRDVDLDDLRREQEAARQESAKAPALRHLLSARRAVYETFGPDVAVHSYFGDPEVRFSLLWRHAPDEYERCEETGESVSVTRLAFQPLHHKIQSPLWQLRLVNASDKSWNHNVVAIASPRESKIIPHPREAVDATFDDLMQHLSLMVHLGWTQDKGDPGLLEHMRRGTFGVRRERSAYEEDMDTRAFSHLLYRVSRAALAANATVTDGMLVLERMLEAGLEPSPADLASLMTIAVGMARSGCDDIGRHVGAALDGMSQLNMPAHHWVCMAGFEAIAWAAHDGKAGLDEAEALVCRMLEEDAGDAVRHSTVGRADPLQDADVWACLMAVMAAAAQGGQADHARMNVAYEEDDDGMVGARALEDGEQALTWNAHAEHLLKRMQLAGACPNSLVHHARMQVAVGSARNGEVDMELLDSLVASLLNDGLAFQHVHAHSLLAAAVIAMEGEHTRVNATTSLRHVQQILDYMTGASLEMDALCYSLWMRGLAHSLREHQADADISDLLRAIMLAHDHGMRFSTSIFEFLGQVSALHVHALHLELHFLFLRAAVTHVPACRRSPTACAPKSLPGAWQSALVRSAGRCSSSMTCSYISAARHPSLSWTLGSCCRRKRGGARQCRGSRPSAWRKTS